MADYTKENQIVYNYLEANQNKPLPQRTIAEDTKLSPSVVAVSISVLKKRGSVKSLKRAHSFEGNRYEITGPFVGPGGLKRPISEEPHGLRGDALDAEIDRLTAEGVDL